jgi:hypothetical protein
VDNIRNPNNESTNIMTPTTNSGIAAHSTHHHFAKNINFAFSVIDPKTGDPVEYRHLITNPLTKTRWLKAAAKEFRWLTQGLDNSDIKGTDTMFLIPISSLPTGRKPTYIRMVVAERPEKKDPNRVRATVGGNLIDYPDNVSTPNAKITTAKLVINSTISTRGARYCTFDIKNFYLGTWQEISSTGSFLRVCGIRHIEV